LFGNLELKVYVPEGYEEVIAKGLRIELGRIWFTEPRKRSAKAKQNKIDKEIETALAEAKKKVKIKTNLGEREELW